MSKKVLLILGKKHCFKKVRFSPNMGITFSIFWLILGQTSPFHSRGVNKADVTCFLPSIRSIVRLPMCFPCSVRSTLICFLQHLSTPLANFRTRKQKIALSFERCCKCVSAKQTRASYPAWEAFWALGCASYARQEAHQVVFCNTSRMKMLFLHAKNQKIIFARGVLQNK